MPKKGSFLATYIKIDMDYSILGSILGSFYLVKLPSRSCCSSHVLRALKVGSSWTLAALFPAWFVFPLPLVQQMPDLGYVFLWVWCQRARCDRATSPSNSGRRHDDGRNGTR